MSRSSISNSDRRGAEFHTIRTLAMRVLRFATPVLALLVLLELTLAWLGDSWPAAVVAAVQDRAAPDSVYLRGPYFSQRWHPYKLAAIRRRQPEILIVGSSRVTQFRDVMFAPRQEQFYNAGGLVSSADDLRHLVELFGDGRLPRPRAVIVGIDPWHLLASYGGTWPDAADEVYVAGVHWSVLRRIVSGKLRNLWSDARLPARHPFYGVYGIGALARREGSGYRRDGSYQVPARLMAEYLTNRTYRDREEPPVISRIQGLTHQFELPAAVDQRRVRVLLDAMKALRQLRIEVWVFLPPFSSESMAVLQSSGPLLTWWTYYTTELPRLARASGVQVIAVESPAAFGLSDEHMLDGFHQGEVLAARVVRQLVLEAPTSSVFNSVDATRLERLIDSAHSPLMLSAPPSVVRPG